MRFFRFHRLGASEHGIDYCDASLPVVGQPGGGCRGGVSEPEENRTSAGSEADVPGRHPAMYESR
jgi:hypothetical protein